MIFVRNEITAVIYSLQKKEVHTLTKRCALIVRSGAEGAARRSCGALSDPVGLSVRCAGRKHCAKKRKIIIITYVTRSVTTV